jgi:flagellar basal body-associated protein FliL
MNKKKILMKVMTLFIVFIATVTIAPILCTKKVNAGQAVKGVIAIDRQSYKAGDEVAVYFSFTNYDDSFDQDITTMVLEISYAAESLSPIKSSLKKMANDNGGMGFSTISCDANTVTYQFVNVAKPLARGTKDVFSLKFTALTDINDIRSCITKKSTTVQNGRTAVSTPIPCDVSSIVNEESKEVADNDSNGIYVYDEQGNINKDATFPATQDNSADNSQLSGNENNSNNTQGNGESVVGQTVFQDNSGALATSDNSVKTSKNTGKVIVIVVVIACVLLAGGAGGYYYFKIKKNKKDVK